MIGDRIKETREKNNLTQSALAKKFGISRSAVNAWELGVSVPSAQYLIELSKLFKVSTDYLLGIDKAETIDISSLNSVEKGIIYSLLKYFESTKYPFRVSDEEFSQTLEELQLLKKNGVELPDYIHKILDNFSV